MGYIQRRRDIETLENEVRRELARLYGKQVKINGKVDVQVREIIRRALQAGIPVSRTCECCPLLQAFLIDQERESASPESGTGSS